MCLRKLSDCVYSQTTFQASSRVGISRPPKRKKDNAERRNSRSRIGTLARIPNSLRVRPSGVPTLCPARRHSLPFSDVPSSFSFCHLHGPAIGRRLALFTGVAKGSKPSWRKPSREHDRL